MKDTIITAKQKKREIITYFICIGIVFLLNVYAIIHYNTQWKELWTQLPWTLILGSGLWVFWVLLRWIFFGIRRLVCRKKTPDEAVK